MQPPQDSIEAKTEALSEPLPFDIEAAYAVLATLEAEDVPPLLDWGVPVGKEVVERW